ncbi:MAG: Esterase/lipase [Deltaproteobacteria bacterium]|nr:Esterase/lipase [Deltaproteobacteria bacterium]
MLASSPRTLVGGLRQRAGAAVVDTGLHALFHAARLHPRADPARHGVERLRDLEYGAPTARAHRLDVWRPVREGPFPVVLYVHGGGFRILSKDTHWMMALAYARAGYVVFNIDYRLAPAHKFPAAIEDVTLAYRWVVANAARFGGDPARIAVAGESAGASLVTSLVVTTCYERPEPWARATFELGVVPRVALPSCGLYQVSDVDRFSRGKRALPLWLRDRLDEVEHAYLGGLAASPEELALANPLQVFEAGKRPARPLPAFHLLGATRDPLLEDTRRLAVALRALDTQVVERICAGEVHGFDALVWRPAARQCWAERYALLDELMR